MWIFFFFAILCFFCYTLPCFFVYFGGLSLPCHLLCCLLFVYYLFIYLFFFTFMDFLGVFPCKFNCSWHFFTSSDRVPPGELVAQGPRFEDRYERVVSYTNDDLGKRVGWLTRIDGHGTEETVDDGLGGRCLGAGRCPVAPPLAGHGWTIWEMVLIALLFFFLLKIHGDCWQEIAGMVKSSLLNCY